MGVRGVLAEVHALCDDQQPRAAGGAAGGAASDSMAALEQLRQLYHFLGRNLPVLKKPPIDMRSTLIQLASQEPAGSRLLRAAETALQNLQQEVNQWFNKPSVALPCVMKFRIWYPQRIRHKVHSVAVSTDGKWMASGSGDHAEFALARMSFGAPLLAGEQVLALDIAADAADLANAALQSTSDRRMLLCIGIFCCRGLITTVRLSRRY